MLKTKVKSICTNKYTGLDDHVKCSFDCPRKIMPIYNEEILFQKINKYSPSAIKVLNSLIGYANVNEKIYPSQDTIAKKSGVVRQTCNRLLNKLEKDQLVSRKYRHRNTCMYVLNSVFYIPKYREYLSGILPSLKYFCFFLVFAVCGENQKCDTINMNIKYISKINFEAVKRNTSREYLDRMRWFMEKTPVTLPMAVPRCLEKKERVEMKASILIPDFVEAITEVPLTFDDKLELAVFSGPIIQLARKRVASTGNLTNPTAYFKAVCRKEHQARLQSPSTQQSFSKKAAAGGQPSVQKPPLTPQQYLKIKHKMLVYAHSVCGDERAKQRLADYIQYVANKLEEPEQPAIVLQEIQKNSNIAPDYTTDVEIDECDYEPINTHNLFGD